MVDFVSILSFALFPLASRHYQTVGYKKRFFCLRFLAPHCLLCVFVPIADAFIGMILATNGSASLASRQWQLLLLNFLSLSSSCCHLPTASMMLDADFAIDDSSMLTNYNRRLSLCQSAFLTDIFMMAETLLASFSFIWLLSLFH